MIDQLNSITSISMDKFAKAQKTCLDVKKLINSSSLTCSSRHLPSGLTLHTKMSTGKPRIIVPAKLSERVIQQLHKLHHPGVQATKRLMSSNYIWRRVADNMKAAVNNCHQCHLVKTPKHLQPPPGQLPTPARWFNSIHVDLVGPLPESQGF